MNFIVLFPFLIKYYHILFIIIEFRFGCDRPSGLLLFVPAVLFSILTPLFCVSSSVSLSYFVLAVPMRKCLGKHSCMSSPCPIAILNFTFPFSRGEIVYRPKLRLSKSNLTRNNILLFTLVVGVTFLLTFGPVLYEKKRCDYSHIIFYYNTRIHRK